MTTSLSLFQRKYDCLARLKVAHGLGCDAQPASMAPSRRSICVPSCAACNVDAAQAESAVEVRRGKRIADNCVASIGGAQPSAVERRDSRCAASRQAFLRHAGRTPWCSAASSDRRTRPETPSARSPLRSAVGERHSPIPARGRSCVRIVEVVREAATMFARGHHEYTRRSIRSSRELAHRRRRFHVSSRPRVALRIKPAR